MMRDLRGKNVLVLGLGLNQGGVGVARYLVQQGAQVRVTDMQTADRLRESLVSLVDLPISYTLPGHDEADIEWADLVVRNPGVPRESRWLEMARNRGVPVEMEMTLFFSACPAPIIGVTGTKGKTTTTMMIAAMLRERWPGALLAGNMGRSAVMELDALDASVPVVIELSSFQIEGLAERHQSPHIAVITNISEDHLDRYPSFEDYARTKASIAAHLTDDDWLITTGTDPLVADLVAGMPGRHARFGVDDASGDAAFWIESGRFRGRLGSQQLDFGGTDRLPIPGEHARENALAAIAAASLAGVSPELIVRAIPAIQPVTDRMEPVGIIAGVEYVNDTTATVPVATIAALQAYEGRSIVAIAGGSEKHIPLDGLASALVHHASAVVLLAGDATPGLARLLEEAGHTNVIGPCQSMEEAVRAAAEVASPGGVVLLSPGCASFGMFRNEFDRGRQFREAVVRLQSPGEDGGE